MQNHSAVLTGIWSTAGLLSVFNFSSCILYTEIYLGIPGRKPGTSTKVMMGMLKASQKRTKRAPFTEELMSKQPEDQGKEMVEQTTRQKHSVDH